MTAVPDGYAIGVDLGTSNTVAVLRWPDGRTRPLLFDGAPVLPSAVYLDNAGTLHVGRDALRMAALDPARLEPNPKRRVDEATVLLGAATVSTVDMLAAVLGAVARAAVAALGFLPPAALTYPAAWGPARRGVLAQAAYRAGWRLVRFVPEPVAAARYFTDVLRRPVPAGSCLAVFDFGAGTLDIAVLRAQAGAGPGGVPGFVVLGDGGVEDLGGLDVDAALVEHLGGLLARTAPAAWAPLARPDSAAKQRERRQFWDDVRGAKEMLSRTAVAPVAVPGLDEAVHLTREELDRVAGPLLHRAVRETAAVIDRCGLRPSQLAGLFLVGGSSRLPIMARLLHAELGVAPTVLEQPELPVAEGAIVEPIPPAGPAPPAPAGAAGVPVSAMPTSPPVAPVSAMPTSPPVAPQAPVSAMPTSPPVPPVPPGPPPVPLLSPGPPEGYPVLADRPWVRHRLAWLAGTAFALVFTLLSTFAYLNRDAAHEVAFIGVTQLGRVAMGGSQSAPNAFAAVRGDQAWLGYQQGTALHLSGYDLRAGRAQTWQATLTPTGNPSNAQWKGLVALPGMVLGYVETYTGTKPYELIAVTDRGATAWRLPMGANDRLVFTRSMLVLADEDGHRLVGIDPRTGHRWTTADPISQYGATTDTVLPVTGDQELAGPSTMDGSPAGPDLTADDRIVQIGADRAARLIDAKSGRVLKQQNNVGEYDFTYLAYHNRLYVADNTGGYRVLSYDLNNLGDGSLVYTAGSTDRRIRSMTGCGPRICLMDQSSDGDKSTRLVSVDPAGGTWVRSVPGATEMVPVGDRVMVVSEGGTARYTMVFDPAGRELLGGAGTDQTGVRVTDGSVMLFSEAPTTGTGNQSLTGYGVYSNRRIQLGEVREVRAAGCAWNDRILVCPGDTDFGIWRFTR